MTYSRPERTQPCLGLDDCRDVRVHDFHRGDELAREAEGLKGGVHERPLYSVKGLHVVQHEQEPAFRGSVMVEVSCYFGNEIDVLVNLPLLAVPHL